MPSALRLRPWSARAGSPRSARAPRCARVRDDRRPRSPPCRGCGRCARTPGARSTPDTRKVASRAGCSRVAKADAMSVVERVRVQVDRAGAGGSAWKRSAERSTSGSIATPAPLEGHLDRGGHDAQGQLARRLGRRLAHRRARAAPASPEISCGQLPRSGAAGRPGSTPKPAAARHHGDVVVGHLEASPERARVVVAGRVDAADEGVDPARGRA